MRPKLSKKEVKILEYEFKTHLSARPESRKPKKGVQNVIDHESAFRVQKYHSALLECRSALSKCQMAPFWALAQLSSGWHLFGHWPNSLQVPIRHILFNFFAKRRVPICTLLIVAYFLSIPISTNRD